jgi:hypothetical protein
MGTPYVSFGRPTEVPDRVIERRLECLFFDSFNHIEEQNNHRFGYLKEDFDNTIYDEEDEYPFEDGNSEYFKFCAIKENVYCGIKEDSSSNKNNKSIEGGNNMEKLDLGQIISMKMVSSLIADDKKDIDIGKMYLLQSMQSNGKIEITDVMKSKMISKLGLDKDTDELPLEKLMLLDMLQSGELDLTKIISVKLMSKLFDEEEKK